VKTCGLKAAASDWIWAKYWRWF